MDTVGIFYVIKFIDILYKIYLFNIFFLVIFYIICIKNIREWVCVNQLIDKRKENGGWIVLVKSKIRKRKRRSLFMVQEDVIKIMEIIMLQR